MKTRAGFVSNSSSSSFICQVCGDVESGYDWSEADAGMRHCQKGHSFHLAHCEKDIHDISTKEKYEYLKKCYEESIATYKSSIQKTTDKRDGKVALSVHEKRMADGTPEYFDGKIKYYNECIERYEARLENLAENYANLEEDEFLDIYEDTFIDKIADEGYPEEFCPVCALLKKAEQDEEYQEYQRLQEKFSYIAHI